MFYAGASERDADFPATIRLHFSRIPPVVRFFSGKGNRPHGRRLRPAGLWRRTHFAHYIQSSLGDRQLATPRRQRRDGSTGRNGQKVLGILPWGSGDGRLIVQVRRANSRILPPGRKRPSARLQLRWLVAAFGLLAGNETPRHGHSYAYGNHRQLVKAKYFASGEILRFYIRTDEQMTREQYLHP